MNKPIDTFDNMTTDEMCPQLLEMVTQLQKENKELEKEIKDWRINFDEERQEKKELKEDMRCILSLSQSSSKH